MYYKGYNGRKVEEYTIAIISYTMNGKRYTEQRARFDGIETYNKYELYKAIIKSNKQLEKPFVHEIVKAFYCED